MTTEERERRERLAHTVDHFLEIVGAKYRAAFRAIRDILRSPDSASPVRSEGWKEISEYDCRESPEVLLLIPFVGKEPKPPAFQVVGRSYDGEHWNARWNGDVLPQPSHFQPLPAPPVSLEEP